jgi:transposase-like protein
MPQPSEVFSQSNRVCCADRWHLIWLARWAACKEVSAPKPCPSEFRDDVVRVARSREAGVALEQIAKDFGVHPMTAQKWLRRAAADDGAGRGQSRSESAENRELRKRVRLLEQENEVLRRAAAYLSQANLPSKGSTRS